MGDTHKQTDDGVVDASGDCGFLGDVEVEEKDRIFVSGNPSRLQISDFMGFIVLIPDKSPNSTLETLLEVLFILKLQKL